MQSTTATVNDSTLPDFRSGEHQLLKAQLKRLAVESKAFYTLSLLASLVVVITFWRHLPSWQTISWLALQCALPLGQLAFYSFIASNRQVSMRLKSLFTTAGAALSGLAWSSIFVAIDPISTNDQALLFCLLASLAVYATAAFSAYIPAFISFTIAILMAPFAHLIHNYDLSHSNLIFVAGLFSVFLCYSAVRINRSTVVALKYRADKETLIDNLTHSMTQSDQLNQELIQEVQQRVTAELKLKRAHEQLEQTVDNRTQELQQTNHLLEQEMALHKNTTKELLNSQNRLSKSMEVSQLGLWEWDLENDCIYHSHFHKLFGSSNTTTTQFLKHLKSHTHPEDFRAARKALIEHMRGNTEQYLVRYRIRQENGSWLWFEDSGQAVEWNEKGRATRILGTRREVTQVMEHTEKLRLGNIVFQNTTEAIAILDRNFKFITVNNSFITMTGYELNEVIGKTSVELDDSVEKLETLKAIGRELAHNDLWQGEITDYRKSGSAYPMWLKINLVRDSSGLPSHYICLLSDLTARKEIDRKLRYLTHYDKLTGLVNRDLFLDRLHTSMQHSHRTETPLALFLINLDRFKLINDTFGHGAGDKVLRTAAERLSQVFSDADTVSRYNSDEFAIAIEYSDDIRTIQAKAKRAIELLNQPVKVADKELILSASIGISLTPTHTKDMHTLLNQAELARNQAKGMGGNVFYLFEEHLNDSSAERLHLENELHNALLKNQFEVFYQPKQNLKDNCIESAEALIRWNHPEHGLIPPVKFIPLAEQTGLINKIGEFVLRTACQQARWWSLKGFGDIKVSVNLSAQQLKADGFMSLLTSILKETNLEPERLILEITESLLMDDVEATIRQLQEIRDLGVGLSIDDFGTGYSSLSYLKRFPIDILKIDQSFIKEINTNADDAAITKAIIAMAHSLDLRVIAEGVETEESREFLRDQNCDLIQGYLVSRPLTNDQMQRMLANFAA
ncbi:putative bifunctional diguanylate cyclase/phosphodiesterase [Litoribrevibacter albus]|uniref:cyclic-guanylate-specific phosphodiesterase n=1 Tax=Litoribrevibacter albus TaxID=1473156 RepID=A0AA37SBC9_9GAMM|nr:EAL domain-containing protein [Litoribrevibacter albus]GLQ32805.1 GGDEF domain-containing protein [Litoribrevibacter albus]